MEDILSQIDDDITVLEEFKDEVLELIATTPISFEIGCGLKLEDGVLSSA